MSRRALVVGAGFSGLTVAYYLVEHGWQVEITDHRARCGGLLETMVTEHGPVERAANGILNSSRFETLCRQINVNLETTTVRARARKIFRGGRARRLPFFFKEWPILLRFALQMTFMRSKMKPHAGETVRDWGTRHLGLKITQEVLEVALQGIYGCNSASLSASLVLRRIFCDRVETDQTALRGTVAPQKGMGELIAKLETYLREKGVLFSLGQQADVSPACDLTVIATSVIDAAEILAAFKDQRAQILGSIKMKSLTSVTVFLREAKPSDPMFGCLFPEDGTDILGVLRNSDIFAGRSHPRKISETWIFSTVDLSDGEILVRLRLKRQILTGESCEIYSVVVTRWPSVLPDYDTTLEAKLKTLSGISDRVALIGNYLGGIGLKQILERAERLAKEVSA